MEKKEQEWHDAYQEIKRFTTERIHSKDSDRGNKKTLEDLLVPTQSEREEDTVLDTFHSSMSHLHKLPY